MLLRGWLLFGEIKIKRVSYSERRFKCFMRYRVTVYPVLVFGRDRFVINSVVSARASLSRLTLDALEMLDAIPCYASDT